MPQCNRIRIRLLFGRIYQWWRSVQTKDILPPRGRYDTNLSRCAIQKSVYRRSRFFYSQGALFKITQPLSQPSAISWYEIQPKLQEYSNLWTRSNTKERNVRLGILLTTKVYQSMLIRSAWISLKAARKIASVPITLWLG